MSAPLVVRCMALFALTALPTGIGATPVRAQQSALSPGTKIRVQLRSGARHHGRVIRSDHDTLVAEWAGGSTPAFPASDILQFEAVTGRHRSVRRAAAVGGIVGASLGAIGGALLYKPCESTEFAGCILAPKGRSESAQVNGAIYGVLGLISGGVVGLFPRDRWQRITPDGNGVRFTHHPLPSGGRGVGLALGF